MNYFDELQLLHEKASYGGLILHGTAGSGLEGVLGGPVGALGRTEKPCGGTGLPCGGRASRAPETALRMLPFQLSLKSCLAGAGLDLEAMQQR